MTNVFGSTAMKVLRAKQVAKSFVTLGFVVVREMKAGLIWDCNRTFGDLLSPLLVMFLVAASASAAPNSVAAPLKSDRQRVFELLDKDGSGQLDIGELIAGSLGKVADNKRNDFEAWDVDGDGELTFQEFVKQGPGRGGSAFDPVREFQSRNLNLDGGLTINEFLLDRDGETAKWERRFADIDSNSDGKITMDEYVGTHERWRREKRWALARPWIVGAVVSANLFAAIYFLPRLATWLHERQDTPWRRRQI